MLADEIVCHLLCWETFILKFEVELDKVLVLIETMVCITTKEFVKSSKP